MVKFETFSRYPQVDDRDKPRQVNRTRNAYLAISLITLFILPTVTLAFGQENAGEYLNRRAEVWNLFFRMTTAAFVIGAVVSGTLIWLIWRFRESHPQNKNPTEWETGEAH